MQQIRQRKIAIFLTHSSQIELLKQYLDIHINYMSVLGLALAEKDFKFSTHNVRAFFWIISEKDYFKASKIFQQGSDINLIIISSETSVHDIQQILLLQTPQIAMITTNYDSNISKIDAHIRNEDLKVFPMSQDSLDAIISSL